MGMNNTVYFRYLEQVRVEWLEQMGSAVSAGQPGRAGDHQRSCTFLVPVNYPATV